MRILALFHFCVFENCCLISLPPANFFLVLVRFSAFKEMLKCCNLQGSQAWSESDKRCDTYDYLISKNCGAENIKTITTEDIVIEVRYLFIE